jgi:hypothetical protein
VETLNVCLFGDVHGQPALDLERLKSFERNYAASGVQFRDLGGGHRRIVDPELEKYLSRLTKSYHFAMRTIWGSLLVVLLAMIDFVRAMEGVNLVHPAISIMLGIAAVCLAIVAMVSGSTSIEYMKRTAREACRV